MPRPRSLLLLGLTAFLCGSTNASTARADDAAARTDAQRTTVEIDSTGTLVAPVLEVQGRRIDAQGRVDRDTGFADVLEASSWQGELSTADVLSRAVGVSVRESGGVGGYAVASLRGSTAAQVPVYLDGMLLNGPGRGAVNLADVDLAQLERIELYRGSAPLTLGGGSLGGAIHLYTRGGPSSLRASLTHGSFETWQGEAAGAWKRGAWTLALRGRAVRSENDWDFLDDKRTPYNPDDDEVVARVNNDARGAGGQLQASRPIAGGTLVVSELIDTREQGLPGRGVIQSETARSRSTTHHARVAWRSRPRAEGRLRTLAIHQRSEVQGVTDRDADLSGVARERTDRLHSIGISTSGAVVPWGATVWRVETSAARLRSQDDALLDGDGEPQSRWSSAIGIQPKWRAFDGRLLLSPGARVEVHEQWWNESSALDGLPRGDAMRSTLWAHTAQIGARVELSQGLALKGNLGIYRRVPTLLELFGDRGTTTANPDLRPEEGVNRDLGLVWSDPSFGARVGFSAFVNDAFDLITFERTSPVSSRARNLGRAEIRGFELQADVAAMGPFAVHAALTRLWTEDQTDDAVAGGKALPFRPGIEFEAETTARFGAVRLGVDLFVMSQNYQQSGEVLRVPSRRLVGASAHYRLNSTWSLRGRVDNLGDVEVHDFLGDPLPGRRLSIALEVGGR